MPATEKILTSNEQHVLYGLVRFPELNDKELATIINMKDSTLTSIKKRLQEQKYFRYLYTPMLNRLGAEMLGIISTNFNPVIPLEERIDKSRESIETNEEIFLSIGAREQGFSLSIVKDYTSFARINEKRTEIFGNEKLIEKAYPKEIIFPFRISDIFNFFDYSLLLEKQFQINRKSLNFEAYKNFFNDKLKSNSNPISEIPPKSNFRWFTNDKKIILNEKERKVFAELIKNPDATMQEIGDEVELSRHTVSRMKKKFFNLGLIKEMVIPNLKKIGFNILVFYNFNFSPRHPFNENLEPFLNTNSTIFYAARKFNAVVISAYPEYSTYKEDKMAKIGYLKENSFINYTPQPRKYVYDQIKVLKRFNLTPITEKILNLKNLN